MPRSSQQSIVADIKPLDVAILEKKGYTEIGRVLGEGTYSKVHLATTPEGEPCAVKVINRNKAYGRCISHFLPRELAIIRQLHHPNIIYVMDIFEVRHITFVINELAGKGDLQQYLGLRGEVPDETSPMAKCKLMAKQLVEALDYLHKRQVIHRDIKCENILIDMNENVKVTDFGFARQMTPQDLSSTFCGSAPYAAPELIQHFPYQGAPSDIWSLGVVFYIIITGIMPFDDNDLPKMLKAQLQHSIPFPDDKNVTPPAKELLRGMLHPVVCKRMSIQGIQNSSWLNRTPWIKHTKDTTLHLSPPLKVPSNPSLPLCANRAPSTALRQAPH